MKKFVFMLVTMLTMFVDVASAQVTTKNASIGDNWFVGVNVGAVAPIGHSFDWTNHSWLGDYHKQFGVEIGKWITPVTGLGLSYEAIGNINHSKTWTDMGLTTADVHFNMMNLFAGYKGQPRRFEVEVIPSVGFAHYYGNVYPAPHRFMALGRAAVSANYNFGKNREWAVYVRPGIQYVDRIRHYNGQFDVRVGLTYKIKGLKSKSHNFVVCPYSVTQADYDKALAEIAALKNAPAKIVTQTVEVVKNNTVIQGVNNSYTISFDQGKSNVGDLSEVAKALNSVKGNIIIVGGTSPEGSEEFNSNLGLARANAVKDALVKAGVDTRRIAVTSDYSKQRHATIIVE